MVRLAVLAVAAGLAGVPSAAVAATVSGEVTKLPKDAKARSVRVLAAQTGEVLAAKRLRGSKYKLSLPPGPVLVGVDARTAARNYGAVSGVVTARKGKTTRVRVRARKLAPVTAAPAARAAAVDPGTVMTIDGVVVDTAPGRGLSLDNTVLRLAFDGCSAHGARFVDRSRQVVDAINREQALHPEFQPTPLDPQLQISGQGTLSNGNATVVIDVTDLASGTVVAHYVGSGSLDDAIEEAVEAFMEEQCGVPIPTRCPKLNGKRLACVTSVFEIGGGAVAMSIDGGKCTEAAGYYRSILNGLKWQYEFGPGILHSAPGGTPDVWSIEGDYFVDERCTTAPQQCTEPYAGRRNGAGSLESWTGTGRPGHWELRVPVLAEAVGQRCPRSAINDPELRRSAFVTTTLRGKANRTKRRMKVVPFSLSKTLPCGDGCTMAYDLRGRIVIRGEW